MWPLVLTSGPPCRISSQFLYSRLERVSSVRRCRRCELTSRIDRFKSGPRGSQALVLAAKARAILRGQTYVSCDDVASVALPVFRHRIVANFAAQSEGVTSDDITRRILETIPKDEKLAA